MLEKQPYAGRLTRFFSVVLLQYKLLFAPPGSGCDVEVCGLV